MAARKTSSRARTVRYEIATPEDVPEVIQAAGLLLCALRRSKTESLAELCLAVANDPDNRTYALPGSPDTSLITVKIGLTDGQWQLILSWGSVLEPVRLGENVRVTIAACPQCGRYAYVPSAGAMGTKCWFSVGCPGKPVKAKAARATRIIETQK